MTRLAGINLTALADLIRRRPELLGVGISDLLEGAWAS